MRYILSLIPPPPPPPVSASPRGCNAYAFAAAVGAEFPKDLTNLEGDDAYGEIAGMRQASFSFPVEVKEYEAFDMDTFKEME